MKVDDWLKAATRQLESAGITTARLDALILLEDAFKKDRAWLLAYPEHELDKSTLAVLDRQIERRIKHEPLAYIRGKSEFYGREFKVTPATLQPRPETETMIELLPGLKDSKVKSIADVGTGSGALAITVKLELSRLEVMATEINADALKVAKENARLLSAEVEFYQGNLLEPLRGKKIDVILANLPYVPDSHTINQAAMQEPRFAIFGGEDGLDLYRELFAQISNLKYQVSAVLTESLPFQHEELAKIADSSGYRLVGTEDFIQVFSVISPEELLQA